MTRKNFSIGLRRRAHIQDFGFFMECSSHPYFEVGPRRTQIWCNTCDNFVPHAEIDAALSKKEEENEHLRALFLEINHWKKRHCSSKCVANFLEKTKRAMVNEAEEEIDRILSRKMCEMDSIAKFHGRKLSKSFFDAKMIKSLKTKTRTLCRQLRKSKSSAFC